MKWFVTLQLACLHMAYGWFTAALAGSTRRYSSAVLTLSYPKSDWINQISEKGQSKVTFIKEVHCGQIWILQSEQFGRVSNTTTLEEEPSWTLVWDRHKKLKPHIYNVLYEFGGFSGGLRGKKYPSRKGISKIFATWKMSGERENPLFQSASLTGIENPVSCSP